MTAKDGLEPADAESGESSRSRHTAGIVDVAKYASVSNMTVSRVINDQPGVGEKTRERIRAIMQELNYQPNTSARALKTGRPSAVGIICLATTLYGPAVTLFGVEQAARAAGFSVNVISLNEITKATLAQAMSQLSQLPVALVIIISPLVATGESLRDLPTDLPTVAIWAPSDSGVAVATVDHERASAAVTQHLLSLGHKTVWHVSGPHGWTGAEHRIAGWRAALQEAGRKVPDVVEGDWTAHSGFEAGMALLKDPNVTAIFAANDPMALGILQAARQLGRAVPEELSVVGYDDAPDSAYYSPPLTTVRQDFRILGERALQLGLKKIGHATGPSLDTLVEPELIIRETTAPPPSRR